MTYPSLCRRPAAPRRPPHSSHVPPVMQFKVPGAGNPHHGVVLHPDPRIVCVPPDHFEVTADDVLFTATLDGTLAVCLYDAVEEHGALLHLRFIARGASQTDVTDRTLASDLLLLDRCVERFRGAMERGIDVQGKIAASVEAGEPARLAADAVLTLEQGHAAARRQQPGGGQARDAAADHRDGARRLLPTYAEAVHLRFAGRARSAGRRRR